MTPTKKHSTKNKGPRGASVAIERSYGPHDACERDDRELRFYFSRGGDEKRARRGLNPEQVKTFDRVHRRLNGYGYNLMLHYTGGEADIVALRREYLMYRQNAQRSYAAAAWEPFRVIDAVVLRDLLSPPSSAHQTVETGDGRLAQIHDPAHHRFSLREWSTEGPTAKFMAYSGTEVATWGGRRVSAIVARELLEVLGDISFVENKRLGDDEILRRLDRLITKNEQRTQPALAATSNNDWRPVNGRNPRDWLDPSSSDTTQEPRRIRANERRKLSRATRALYDQAPTASDRERQQYDFDRLYGPGGKGLAELKPDIQGHGAVPEWRMRGVERNVGAATCTISELARQYKLDATWIRAALKKHGYPGAPGSLVRGARLSVEWLGRDRGLDFARAAEAEANARWRQREVASSTRFSSRRRGV